MAKFSYSVTRDNMFRECPRGYYLYYYGEDIGKESFKMAEDKGKCHSCQFFNICYKGEEDNSKQ